MPTKSASRGAGVKRKPLRINTYYVPEYILEALEMLRAPDDMTVSEWAEKYRMLDAKSSAIPGPWRNDKTPYLVDIMNEMLNYETEEVIFAKCTQVGGTEAMQNMIGYIVQQDPSPTMIVYPTDLLGESISKNRLEPMINATPELEKRYHKLDSTRMELQFDGMYLTIAGSNSPSSLASKAIKYLMLDEVDKYPGASKKESDPISLARERTKTFRGSKVYMTSTPTLANGHIWKALSGADVEKHYVVPCPHCGEYIELVFKQIRWPDGSSGMTDTERAEQAAYVCQECGCFITDSDKDGMLRAGRWREVRTDPVRRRKVAFWINTLYSPFVRFSEIALEFMESRHDPEKLQNFVNSWLAEPWEDTFLKTEAQMVLDRQTDLEQGAVPGWAEFLTAGVDVQETSLYYTIRAWGKYLTSQNIAHGQVRSFTDISAVMNAPYFSADGTQHVVSLCLIDSGYSADDTYEYCAENSEWALPVKGSSHPMMTHFKLSKVNKADSRAYGIPLALVDGDKYKDMIASRMRKKNGPGSWMTYKGCDAEYAEQVTAEQKVNEKAGGQVVQRWRPKRTHIDNHYLDAEVYAFAAADILGVRQLFAEAESGHEKVQDTSGEIQHTPEESWIGEHENWIGG